MKQDQFFMQLYHNQECEGSGMKIIQFCQGYRPDNITIVFGVIRFSLLDSAYFPLYEVHFAVELY